MTNQILLPMMFHVESHELLNVDNAMDDGMTYNMSRRDPNPHL
jgi:hypothetical protein